MLRNKHYNIINQCNRDYYKYDYNLKSLHHAHTLRSIIILLHYKRILFFKILIQKINVQLVIVVDVKMSFSFD